MFCLPKDNILKFNPDTLESVRKLHGLDKPRAMDEAIDILDQWVKKQNHFTVKDLKRGYLERIIIASKGSVERSKERLDKVCTLRTLMPHYFGDYDPRNDFKNIYKKHISVLLPKMTPEHDRVFWSKHIGSQFETAAYLNGYRFCIMLTEYVRSYDYANAYHIVLDFRTINLPELMSKINLTDLHQGIIIITAGYGLRLKGIHLITSSKMIDTLVALIKPLLSEKLGKRIHVHKNLDTLYQFVPKDVLPVEYGGTERSIDELHEEWVDVLSSKEFKDIRKEMNRALTDESLRQTDTFNEQYMGMPGTFRTLSVD